MKKILLSLCLCCIQAGFAQLSPKVTASFPAHLLIIIDQLNARIPISEDKQLQIGQRLLSKDSQANAKKDQLSAVELNEYYSLHKELLQGILEDHELENFLYQEDKQNRFLLALVKAPELKLNASQLLSIRKKMEQLEQAGAKKPSPIVPYYRTTLDTILDKKQNSMLTYFSYKETSTQETKQEWDLIQQLQLVKNKDPKKAYSELLNYNTARNIYLDEAGEKFLLKNLNDKRTTFILEKQPLFLMHKKILVDNLYQNSLFAIALLHEKKMELSASQVDSLLVKCKELELLKNNNKGNEAIGTIAFINKNSAKILDTKQLMMALFLKNEEASLRFANESWNQIEKQNWTAGLDKKQTIKEFRNYKINALVAQDKVKVDGNQANLFARRDIENKKPELLKKLDELKQAANSAKTTKNDLKW